MKRYFAVLDTNVIVSAVLSSTKRESVPVRILESALCGRITPLYNSAIFSGGVDIWGDKILVTA